MQEDLTTAALPSNEPEAKLPLSDLTVPQKFRNTSTGDVNVMQLLRSYMDLERKMGERGAVPDIPDNYKIRIAHEMLDRDPDVDRRLHATGFNDEQAQLVYDLAAERLVPAVFEIIAEHEADRQVDRLIDHFGSPEAWQEVARALNTWGKRSLPASTYQALASSYEGILALHGMMQGKDPAIAANAGPAESAGLEDLDRLMRDPRYWREKDPATVKRVTEGFKRLYPEK